MLLTKDNLLRFVREKKYTIPSEAATVFETSTMIAAAALSELTKDDTIRVTHLKLSSTPYYYDKLQKDALQELGPKHFKGTELALFNSLKESQIINKISLTIPQKVAIEKLKDFYQELDVKNSGQEMKFFVWYLRDLAETKKQIMSFLKGDKEEKKSTPKKETKISSKNDEIKTVVEKEIVKAKVNPSIDVPTKTVPQFDSPQPQFNVEKNKTQEFIENYLRTNYLSIEEIDKLDNGVLYSATLKINKLKVHFDCMYFSKKVQEGDLVKFYTSSMKPKIVFIENAPKKLFKLAENLENLEIVNI